MDIKQQIIMRTDLGMRKGKMVAQGAHASLKATLENMEHPYVKKWLEGRFTKICLAVDSEAELYEILAKAQHAGLISVLIEDAGLTEFGGNPTVTCGAVGPASHEELNPITGHLRLL